MSLAQFSFFEICAIYIILAWGVYLPFRADQAYFGAIFSMCIGAYVAAYVSRDLSWPFWLAIIAAALFCMLFSLIFAYNLAALGGFPLMIASTALLFIVQTVIRNLPFLGGTQGFFGIPFVPQYTLLALTYSVLLILGVIIYRIDRSYIGRAMDVMRFNKNVAASLGIDARKTSMQLQLIASGLGALAGGFYAFTLGSVTLEPFSFTMIPFTVALVVVGGMQTMWGVVFATPALWSVSQFAPSEIKPFSSIIYAALLIAVLIMRPAGAIDRKALQSINALGRRVIKRLIGTRTEKQLDVSAGGHL